MQLFELGTGGICPAQTYEFRDKRATFTTHSKANTKQYLYAFKIGKSSFNSFSQHLTKKYVHCSIRTYALLA